MGTTKPGNNSGDSMSSGKLIAIGLIILANESTAIATFNQPVRFCFLNFNRAAYPRVISIQPKTLAPITEVLL